MRSRAVPDNFDIAQTLQSYGRIQGSAPIYSPTSIGGSSVRSLALDDLSPRPEDGTLSPYFTTTTPPTSNSDILSPMPYTNDRTFTGYQPVGSYSSASRTNPFSKPNDTSKILSHPNGTMPRLHLHDKSRTLSEPLPAPLKSSTPYAPLDYSDYPLSTGGQSVHGLQYIEPPRSYSSTYLPGYSSMW
jgi:hypothetical protein